MDISYYLYVYDACKLECGLHACPDPFFLSIINREQVLSFFFSFRKEARIFLRIATCELISNIVAVAS